MIKYILTILLSSISWAQFTQIPAATGNGNGSGGLSYAAARNATTSILDLPAITGGYYGANNYPLPAISAATFTAASGTGNVWIVFDPVAQVVKARHNVVGSCSAACTAVSGAAGPEPNDILLSQWAVTSGVMAATATYTIIQQSSQAIVMGANMSEVVSSGVRTISAAGSGDVGGPASAIADNIASYNSVTGKLIKDSGLPSASTGSGNMVRVTGATTVNTTVNGYLKFGAHAVTDTDFDYSAYNDVFRLCWTDNSGVGSGFDLGISRNAAGVMEFNNCTVGTLRDIKMRSVVAGGTSPTVTPGTIGTGSRNASGFITSATTGVFTPVLTFNGTTAPIGWTCAVSNNTTANLMRQTAYTTTTATFSGTTVSGDVVTYNCTAF